MEVSSVLTRILASRSADKGERHSGHTAASKKAPAIAGAHGVEQAAARSHTARRDQTLRL